MTLAPLTSLGRVHRIPIYSRRANVVMQSSPASPSAAESHYAKDLCNCLYRDGLSESSPKNFHIPAVTSNLVRRFQISDHGRGRDGRHKPTRRTSKSFVSRILVSKFFDIRILRGISS